MIDKIILWIGLDGMAHLLACLVICAVLGALLPCWVAALVSVCVGIAKEVYDLLSGRGVCDSHDIVCDVMGAFAGYMLIVIQ